MRAHNTHTRTHARAKYAAELRARAHTHSRAARAGGVGVGVVSDVQFSLAGVFWGGLGVVFTSVFQTDIQHLQARCCFPVRGRRFPQLARGSRTRAAQKKYGLSAVQLTRMIAPYVSVLLLIVSSMFEARARGVCGCRTLLALHGWRCRRAWGALIAFACAGPQADGLKHYTFSTPVCLLLVISCACAIAVNVSGNAVIGERADLAARGLSRCARNSLGNWCPLVTPACVVAFLPRLCD